MKEKKEDRRISRTRKLMHEALMSLIVEKGYEAITVQDILDRADVGRSTFYAHYRDKDELLLSSFEHLRTLFEQQQQAIVASRGSGREPEVNFVLELFRHTGQHHKLYQAIAGKQSGEMILKYLHKYLYNLLIVPHAELVRNRNSPPVPIEITTHVLVSSLLSLMTWWLDNHMPHPPEKMDEIFRILVTPTIEAAFGRKVMKSEYERLVSEHPKGSIMAFYSHYIDGGCCP
ncbi:MAG: TetR/AcrR family transcriptional regulator [Chlorobiaceae bacterium]|nr:TetR/AcrR family transcriptional regulator [Chlorobiaceae bacterium]